MVQGCVDKTAVVSVGPGTTIPKNLHSLFIQSMKYERSSVFIWPRTTLHTEESNTDANTSRHPPLRLPRAPPLQVFNRRQQHHPRLHPQSPPNYLPSRSLFARELYMNPTPRRSRPNLLFSNLIIPTLVTALLSTLQNTHRYEVLAGFLTVTGLLERMGSSREMKMTIGETLDFVFSLLLFV